LVAATVVDAASGAPVPGATVSLYDAHGNKVVTKATGADGLAEFIVECDTDSELEVVMDGFESRRVPVAGTREREVGVTVALDPIESIVTETEVVLAPIYFDFDASNITAPAAFELDKLVQVMQKYPDMV